jgi:hypothetical protein
MDSVKRIEVECGLEAQSARIRALCISQRIPRLAENFKKYRFILANFIRNDY